MPTLLAARDAVPLRVVEGGAAGPRRADGQTKAGAEFLRILGASERAARARPVGPSGRVVAVGVGFVAAEEGPRAGD